MQVGISADAVVTLLATMRAGLVPVCAVPAYRAYEMAALAAASGARAHVVETGSAGAFDLHGLARELQAAHSDLRWIFASGSEATTDALALEDSSAARLDRAAARVAVRARCLSAVWRNDGRAQDHSALPRRISGVRISLGRRD